MQLGLFGGGGNDAFVIDSLENQYGDDYTPGDLIGEHDWRKLKAIKDIYDIRPRSLSTQEEVLKELKESRGMAGREFSDALEPRIYNELMQYKSNIGDSKEVEISTEEVQEVLEGVRDRRKRKNISTNSFEEGYRSAKSELPPPGELKDEKVAEFKSIMKKEPSFMGIANPLGARAEVLTSPNMGSLQTDKFHETAEEFDARKNSYMDSSDIKLGLAVSASFPATGILGSIPGAVNGIDPSTYMPFKTLFAGGLAFALGTLTLATYSRRRQINKNHREFGKMKATMDRFHERIKLDKEEILGNYQIRLE